MNRFFSISFNRLFQQAIGFLLSFVVAFGVWVSASPSAQAAVDTASAATKADAQNIKQRKEEAPHYPNWYDDQRSLESYMDNAGIDSKYANRRIERDEQGNIIEQSQERLKDMADNIRDTLSPSADSQESNRRSNATTGYNRNDAIELTDNIPDRIQNRLEQAKSTFQKATENAIEENDTIITGTSNS
jgi:hypothetical protein